MRYELRACPPDPETLRRLRQAADMRTPSPEAARRGLPNTVYGVHVRDTDADETVGMARIVGDGGCVYFVCDMVVHPEHQGQGLGSSMMEALMDYLEENAPESAYVGLMADVDGFYERWGFVQTAPASKGMWLPRE